jgi:photosystem II stability/assembly factor-like uncharacterized protein
MHSNTRLVISFGIACVGYLATALLVLPATAGTNSWTWIGPVAYPFAVDPSSPSTIYSVVNGNAVTKTTDGGGHWADLAIFAVDSVNCLVIDPASPATIYAALGDPWDLADVPIYKSIDGGARWAAEAAEFNGLPTSVVAIAPSLSSTLYAGANEAVFKSSDGGLSWEMRSNGLTGFYVSALAIDPTNADAVYVGQQVAGGPDTGKVFKSTNGGEQWREVQISVPVGAVITSVTIDPATPSVVYAAYAYSNASKNGGVFKSFDSGDTWIAAQNGLSDTNVLALAIDPSTSRRIYAATQQGVFRSTDAAASWTPINDGLGPNLNVLAVSMDGNGSILRAATSAGLFEYQMTTPPSAGAVAVIEYFNALFDDYFITASPDEISKLDNGAFPGWARTGLQFNAYATLEVPAVSVCRFLSTGFAPKSTHFYTPFASECSTLRLDSNWELESASAFAIALPDADGVCAAGLIPVYRLYNLNQGGVPNHRYTTDPAVRAQMMAQGWVAEGLGPNAVEMCSPM